MAPVRKNVKTKPKTAAPAQKPKPAPTPPKQSTSVVPREQAKVPANVMEAMKAHAGKGVSHRMEDNIVPLIYVLQPLSPQVLKGNEKQIPGAEAGDIWLRNQPAETCIIKGEEGMLFQPCYFVTCWIEWMPERGGFVARHVTRPKEAQLKDIIRDDGSKYKGWKMPNGNTVNESREYSGFVSHNDQLLPYTLPLSGSGHTVGKSWMTSMRDRLIPGTNDSEPTFANWWLLTTKLRSKNNNNWYQYEVAYNSPVEDVEDIIRGAALNDAFEKGAKSTESYDEDAANLDGGAQGGGAGETAGAGADDEI